MKTRLLPAATAAALLVLVAASAANASPDRASTAKLLVERAAPTIVPLRIVISAKISMQGQSFDMPEKEQTVQGVMVDPSGLVMTASESGLVKALERSMPGLSVAVAVKSVKVQIPTEPKDRDAVVVARDPTNGLAFVQILGAEGTKFPALDLAAGKTAAVGSEVFGVRRLDRGFDYAPSVLRGFVCGQFEQPRPMTMLAGNFREFGLPIWDEQARIAGVYVIQVGSEGIDVQSLSKDSITGALLSVEAARQSVEQAKKKVPEALEKAKGEPEKPAEPTKPPAPAEGEPSPKEPSPTPPQPGMDGKESR